MFKKLSIQAKLISTLGLIALINIVAGGILLNTILNASAVSNDVKKISSLNEEVIKYEKQITLTGKFLTSFINSGSLGDLELYNQNKARIEPLYQNILKHDLPSNVKEQIVNIQNAVGEWQDKIASKQVIFMQRPETVDLARLLEASPTNVNIWTGIRNNASNLVNSLEERVRENTQAMSASMSSSVFVSSLGLALTILAIIGASIFIVLSVSKPLQKLVLVTNKLVQKQWGTEIDAVEREDEIGDMAKALLQFRDNGIENDRLVAEQKEIDSKRLERAKEVEHLVEDFRSNVGEVIKALGDATRRMISASENMNTNAESTYNLSEEVSKSAENAGSNVSAVSSATEELTASIQEISQRLSEANKKSNDAMDLSSATLGKIKTLEESANEIGNVIQIISDIAEQTNLLALNATIEAARAGDAGKGFAIVASEVKNLANETAKATEEVKSRIDRIQGDTGQTVNFIEQISQSIENLTASVVGITAAMEEQTAATQEISRNVSEASSSTNGVVQNISDVREATLGTQKTAQNVSEVSQLLSQRSDSLKTSIEDFIDNIQE